MNTSCSRFVLFIIAHMLCATQAFAQAKAFAFTGNVQTFVIPDNVISISIDIAGGTGGSSYFSKGGFGGRVQCRMSVTPGEVLNIFIGGAGKESSRKMPAGFNGGSPDMDDMAGGGGASDIRVGGTALSNRVVVAGGGGGASYHFNKKDSERGGAGGGLKGGNGYYNSSNKVTSYGGGGGTAKSGGHGADGDYYVGLSGAAGVGGAGAWYYFGGGGGGGYFGGGGGSMGGGGGGSSYTDPMTTSAVQHTAGYNKNGNGRLVITLYYTRDNNGVGASKNKHIITPDTTM